MDFGFSPEQDMLRQTARAFLAENCPHLPGPADAWRMSAGIKPELWKEMAELGWLGLAFPGRVRWARARLCGPHGYSRRDGRCAAAIALFRFRAVSWSDDSHRRLGRPRKKPISRRLPMAP